LANVQAILPNLSELSHRYLYFRVNREDYWTRSGSAQPFIKPSDIGNSWLALPPLSEQTRIAEVLDTLDEAIREAQAVIFKQGAVYQGLQEQFFTPGAVRDREGWQEMQLEDIAESITSGPRGWATYYADEGDYFLRIGNLTRKHLDLRFDDVVKVKPPIGAEGVRTALAPGDLLISITADLGIIGVVPDWMGVAYINQHIARARLDRNKVNPRFLGYQLSGLIGQKQFYRLNDVGAKAGLNLPAVGGLKVWLPPLAEQDRIAGTLDGLQQALQQEEAVHSNLKSLKSGLSSDLLTGRVRTRPH
jgi:type I restriction enzyme S subunit